MTFQRTMQRLAMFAALLLAVMPTVGRLWSSTQAGQGAAGALIHAMAGHAVAGAPMHRMAMVPQAGDAAAKHPASFHHDHDDCAYCGLLNTMAGPVLLLALLLPQDTPVHHPQPWREPRIVALHPCGLGSRGPPQAA